MAAQLAQLNRNVDRIYTLLMTMFIVGAIGAAMLVLRTLVSGF